MKRAEDSKKPLRDFLKTYNYQPQLTADLDALGSERFTQEVINEIVLWKVNRYARLAPACLAALNGLAGVQPRSHRTAAPVLKDLLSQDGVDLAMASTLLRFRNRRAFQIIDRHAYRALFGADYPLYSSSGVQEKIELYFEYLDKLFKLADAKNIEFEILDRALYVFDKKENGKLG